MPDKNGVSSYRRFLQGDIAALEELIRTYSDALVRFACYYVRDPLVAEDIMEDAFAALIIKRRHFSDCENFRAYLYKTVRNKCIDHLRFHRKHVSLQDVEYGLVACAETDIVEKERNEKLYFCMQSLAPQYRDVLYLTYFEDCNAGEAAKILKKSKKQVYNLLTRARSALKEALKKEGISYEDV